MDNNIFTVLDELEIEYDLIEHVPVYTSQQARELIPHRPGASAKNLFLRDKKGKQHYLLVIDDLKKTSFDDLAKQIGTAKISMASESRLEKYLGIETGAVSLLAMINDKEKHVQLLFDEDLWQAEALQCHPLVNTATVTIAMEDIRKFLRATGHEVQLVKI